MKNIRNFCIIAHIDHGKSTLADRMLEITGTISTRDMKEQILDKMDLEREKGITIKLQPVRMEWGEHELFLIDTPGHVDFSYEVSRSLAACEGALLVVDATQGIQAQTLANLYLAFEADLKIIPVINKIDLPAADVDKVTREIISLLGCTEDEIIKVSAKTGTNVDSVLHAIVERVPEPQGTANAPARALIFDSYYDDYRGVVLMVRVVDGEIHFDEKIHLMASGADGHARDIGFLVPDMKRQAGLKTGEIGYIVSDLRTIHEAKVGDTVTTTANPAQQALPGYSNVTPFVYAGIFPVSAEDYPKLKEAIEKVSLYDASLTFEPENSAVLGFGFRVGFLGMLHMDIIKERIERDNHFELVITNPSTDYEITLMNGETFTIKNASDLPDMANVTEIREPWIDGELVCPKEYVGSVIQLVVNARGMQKDISYVDDQIALITFEAPLANMLTDFYDQLKSVTSGYGSFSYEIKEYRPEDLVKLDILVGGEKVDSLSVIVHKTEADRVGRSTVIKLKDVIPKQLFKVSLQAAIGSRVIAREDIQALKKNVTGHLYGGDVSRKKKLWAKQKAGKARMKKFGKVEIPPEAFTVMLRKD